MPPVVPCPRPTDIWPLAGTCPARSPFGRWAGGGNPLLSVESLTRKGTMSTLREMSDSLSLSNMSDLMVLTISHLCLSALPRRERSAYHCSACASLSQRRSHQVEWQLTATVKLTTNCRKSSRTMAMTMGTWMPTNRTSVGRPSISSAPRSHPAAITCLEGNAQPRRHVLGCLAGPSGRMAP